MFGLILIVTFSVQRHVVKQPSPVWSAARNLQMVAQWILPCVHQIDQMLSESVSCLTAQVRIPPI